MFGVDAGILHCDEFIALRVTLRSCVWCCCSTRSSCASVGPSGFWDERVGAMMSAREAHVLAWQQRCEDALVEFSLDLAGTEDWQGVNFIREVQTDSHRFECSLCGKRLQCVAYCHEHVGSRRHWRRLEGMYPRLGLVSLRPCPEFPTADVASPGLSRSAHPGFAGAPDLFVGALEFGLRGPPLVVSQPPAAAPAFVSEGTSRGLPLSAPPRLAGSPDLLVDALESSGSEDSDHFTAERIVRDPWDRGRSGLRGPPLVGSQLPASALGSASGLRPAGEISEASASAAGPRALGDSPSLAPLVASSSAPRGRPARRSVTFEEACAPAVVSPVALEVLEEF